ncbi:hypothetical protein [Flagellimonas pacifica]|uniref:General secretion pathway protein n=1 Tax=Flagellimonas pacifica TaxID=1247520 RepID=A0A285MR66_9FLAO|nr:hypothetical protein [Allomuricauda parva]SNY99670.1 hypothetical protein SAMN06265377_1481 [Allomuricauda parva]
MWKSLKNKNTLLLFGFSLAIFLCYKLAISKTLILRKEYQRLSQEEQLFRNVPQQLALLSKKESHLDSLLQQLNLNNTSLENDLLRMVNHEVAKNDLKVIDFNPPHVSEINGTLTKTYNFTLRGPFTSLIRLIHTLEQQYSFGQITHLDFTKQKNYRSRKDYLEVTVFIQRLE